MYADLQSYVAALDRAGELVHVPVPVSPVLEIAEIAHRVSRMPARNLPSASARASDPRFHDLGGAALLFERVNGSDFPVLINAFGSYRRMEMALGAPFADIAERIAALTTPQPPGSVSEALAAVRNFAPLLRTPPKRIRGRGACQEIVRRGGDVDLTRLPIIRCWPLDGDLEAVGYPGDVNAGLAASDHAEHMDAATWRTEFAGRYITFAGVHTIHADDRDAARPRSHNIGMYRMQLLGRNRLAMHWHMHHDGAAHWRSWKKLGRPMPVAIVLGGPSVLPYAATCPLPGGVSELLMAGFLQRRGVRLCRASSVPLWVPADAEIVLEGHVRTDGGFPGWDARGGEPLGPGAVFEGPFGDHTGFYSMPDRYPIMEVSAVTHRRGAIYPTTIVGLPPQEDYYLAKATERIMLPLLRAVAPDIVDYDLPLFGAFHNCAVVQIDKAFAMHARRAINAVWSAGQMAWTKMVIVVDRDVDVHDTPAVLRAAAARCDPARDIVRLIGPLDVLDHAAPWLGVGGKIGIDATRKLPDEIIRPEPRPPHAPATAAECAQIAQELASVAAIGTAHAPAEASGWAFVALTAAPPAAASAFSVAEDALGVLDRAGLPRPGFLSVLGPGVRVEELDHALFHLCANADFERDMRIIPGPGGRATAVFDATPKREGREGSLPVRPWPPLIEMDDRTRAMVSARWEAYQLGEEFNRARARGL